MRWLDFCRASRIRVALNLISLSVLYPRVLKLQKAGPFLMRKILTPIAVLNLEDTKGLEPGEFSEVEKDD